MGATGEFVRDTRYLDGRFTADGREGTFRARADRYRLVVARACPWANRTMIVRRLLGLEPALSMGICGPEHDWRSWTFDLDPGEVDPVLGIHWLREAFERAVPGYDRGVTVPAIVEVASGAVVTADYRQITLDLEHEWTAFHRPGAPDLYPDKLRDEIEEISAGVYEDLNNGVYKCGFASTQDAYEDAYSKLFARLDALSERLANRRYLAGNSGRCARCAARRWGAGRHWAPCRSRASGRRSGATRHRARRAPGPRSAVRHAGSPSRRPPGCRKIWAGSCPLALARAWTSAACHLWRSATTCRSRWAGGMWSGSPGVTGAQV